MTLAPPAPDTDHHTGRGTGHAARRGPDRALRLRAGARLVARFGTVGLLAFVVDVGLFNLARHALDLGPLTSKTLSVVVATGVAYLGNRQWTFGDRARRPESVAAALFVVVNVVALLLSLGCLALTTYGLGLTSPLAENVSTNVVGLGLGMLFRFWAYHRWVFPSQAAPVPDTGRAGPADRAERPWGRWQVLDEGAGFKVKRITVRPGRRLSYQTHERRAEHWVVVRGRATCVVDGERLVREPGESVDVAVGQAHRISNEGRDELEIVEVQLGSYTGEDDIVRLEDDFGRVDGP